MYSTLVELENAEMECSYYRSVIKMEVTGRKGEEVKERITVTEEVCE